MINFLDTLNKHSKVFLYSAVIFASLSIFLHLIISEPASDHSEGFIRNKLDQVYSDFTDTLNGLANNILPIDTSPQTYASLDDAISSTDLEINTEEGEETDQITIIEILSDQTFHEAILKGILGVLLSFLVVSYVLKQSS